jgi:hypothetical protein
MLERTRLVEALSYRDAKRMSMELSRHVCDTTLRSGKVWVHGVLDDPKRRPSEWSDLHRLGVSREAALDWSRRFQLVPAFIAGGDQVWEVRGAAAMACSG